MPTASAHRRRGPLAAVLLVLLAISSTGCVSVIEGSPAAAPPSFAPAQSSPAPRSLAPAQSSPAPVPGSDAPAQAKDAPAPPGDAPTPSVDAPPVMDPGVPGWNVARSARRAAAYDVPPTWTVQPESAILGFRDGAGNMVASSGAATFGEDVCGDGSNLALAVLRHDEGTDLADAALRNAELWADAAYRDDAGTAPVLSTAAPETITTAAGQPASVVEVTATLPAPVPPCGTTTGSTYAVAAGGFAGELGPTVVLVVVADVGVPGAAPESDIRRLLSSLRPAG